MSMFSTGSLAGHQLTSMPKQRPTQIILSGSRFRQERRPEHTSLNYMYALVVTYQHPRPNRAVYVPLEDSRDAAGLWEEGFRRMSRGGIQYHSQEEGRTLADIGNCVELTIHEGGVVGYPIEEPGTERHVGKQPQ